MAPSVSSLSDVLVCSVAVLVALGYLVRRYTSHRSGCGACPSKSPKQGL